MKPSEEITEWLEQRQTNRGDSDKAIMAYLDRTIPPLLERLERLEGKPLGNLPRVTRPEVMLEDDCTPSEQPRRAPYLEGKGP